MQAVKQAKLIGPCKDGQQTIPFLIGIIPFLIHLDQLTNN